MTDVEENCKEQDSLINETGQDGGGVCAKLVRTKSARLSSMLTLIGIYFMAEIIVGHITNSLTLVADSFHMLSDALSLIVALTAVRMSKRKAHESITPWPFKREYFNTFGWVRFEVVGALINATFLLALCISILMEAIEKFYDPQLVNNPELILAVGGGGLAINLLGLVMFGSHAHAGHDHDHDHGDHGHSHKGHDHKKSTTQESNGMCKVQGELSTRDGGSVNEKKRKESEKMRQIAAEEQMNMKAVFLHVLGDALGSVIVMISATVVLLVPHHIHEDEDGGNCTHIAPQVKVEMNTWIRYMDPVMSVVLVFIMITTTVPLFKKSSLILLQTVPKNIKLHAIKEKMETIEGVQELHDFHIWQLAGDKYVATVHIQCSDSQTYLRVAREMKEKLHDEDIHSLTIQPEFKQSPTRHCSMVCASDVCKTKVCCEIETAPINKKPSKVSMAPSTDSVIEIKETSSAKDVEDVADHTSSLPSTDI